MEILTNTVSGGTRVQTLTAGLPLADDVEGFPSLQGASVGAGDREGGPGEELYEALLHLGQPLRGRQDGELESSLVIILSYVLHVNYWQVFYSTGRDFFRVIHLEFIPYRDIS